MNIAKSDRCGIVYLRKKHDKYRNIFLINANKKPHRCEVFVVGARGFEPATSCTSSKRRCVQGVFGYIFFTLCLKKHLMHVDFFH